MQMWFFSKERELVTHSEQVSKPCSSIGFYLEESSCTVLVKYMLQAVVLREIMLLMHNIINIFQVYPTLTCF